MKRIITWSLGLLLAASCSVMLPAQDQVVAAAPTNTAAWKLARYATDLKYQDLPPEVVANAKRRILDTLGAALGGYSSRPITILREVIVSEGGTPESTIIGSGQRTNAANAAMVNGAMIRYLDFNDTYWGTKGIGFMHPSDSIAEALSVSERQHASGKDLILATVIAYEIQSRLANTFRWPGLEQHSGAGFTAPIVAGKLLHLTPEQMANAIGIGASHNFALAGDYGIGYTSNMKALGYAAGSSSGVTAALLAQKGFTGPVTIIESYVKDFEKTADLGPLVDDRKDFLIMKAEMKPYEAFHVSHSSIMGVIDLTKENHIDPDQIEKVLVRGLPNRRTTPAIRNTRLPLTKEDADHNLAFLLATGIMDGAVGPDQYAKMEWKQPRMRELMGKMWFQGDAEMTKNFPEHWDCDVTITMKNGTVYTKHIDLPKGQPGNPMTDQEINAKFSNMAEKLMPKSQIDQIIKMVYNLDKVQDVNSLTKLLVVKK
ncbi:MAG TPA: MmgE/PrpD family protein [Acidobacteriaceae bacterium]|nr:MmgE/PrpD family protein [Acidobacteriaceae bacterium]